MHDWEREIRSRLGMLRLDPNRESAIVEELSQHLEDRYAELRGQGMDHARARSAALEELSEPGRLERELRPIARHATPPAELGSGPANSLDALRHDVLYAVRSFRAHPAFAGVAIATFALTIGACTLIFSAVNGVLRRPLPYEDPEQLVTFWGTAPEKGLLEVNVPTGLFSVYREHTRTLTSVAAFSGVGATLVGAGDAGRAERIEGAAVSPDFFRVLGVPMLLGRPFLPDETASGAVPVVVLSHALWRRSFTGDSSVVGRSITLDGRATNVVGVMPPGFDYPYRAELWMPLTIDADDFGCWCFEVVGRMSPGRVAEDVRREIATITDDFGLRRRDVFPDAKRGGARIIVMSLSDRVVGDLERPLGVLFGAVGLLFLIGCANIANLMLVRANARSRELAVRCCLGAGPKRIAAQLLTESLLLAAAGAAGGLLLAYWGTRALRRLPVDQFPRMNEVYVEPAVLAFTVGVAALTGLLCGLAPVLRASRVELQHAVTSGSRSSGSPQTRRLSDGFVVAQFALSLVLLVAAGLLLRSYRHLSTLDLGYRAENVLVGRISLSSPPYDTSTAVRAFYGQLLDRVRAIPGVTEAGLASRVPLTGGNTQSNVAVEGQEPRAGDPVPVANARTVTPGYFRALGSPLLDGRDFADTDDERAMRVGIVDATFARRFWPNEEAVGKRFRWQGNTSSGPWVTIVGIVPNVKHNRLDETPDLQVYQPFAQRAAWDNYLVVRSTSEPEGLVSRIRDEIVALDPSLPFYDVHTMVSAVRDSLGLRRLMNVLLGGFALIALGLAAIGIYGVISLGVSARGKEFGIRIALGARTADVRWQVLRHGLTLATVGVGLGIAGALALTRLLQRLLFGVAPTDVITFATVALILSAAAVLASYVPARRATRADPLAALRAE